MTNPKLDKIDITSFEAIEDSPEISKRFKQEAEKVRPWLSQAPVKKLIFKQTVHSPDENFFEIHNNFPSNHVMIVENNANEAQ